jgi:N-acetylglucosamine-6-sulfatase
MKTLRALFIVVCTFAILSCSIGQAPAPVHPNIILILTDDMSTADYAYLPKTRQLIGDEGATFNQFLYSMALCCPSRVSILRGQYPHNTEIIGNKPPDGGFEKVYKLGLEQSTAAVWLQEAGYRTALIGKYLNGYPNRASTTYIPAGWTEWYSSVGDVEHMDIAYGEYNYTLNENGTLVKYGDAPKDYGTDVYGAKTIDFIERSVAADEPFFAYVSVYAPHNPSTPAPRHTDLFADLELPRGPSFNEAEIKDKTRYFSKLPELTDEEIADMETKYRLRIQSLQAVDDLVENVIAKLEALGQLDNTYIFFASDNGFHMGEHRLLPGKATAFEEDIRVPMLVRGPGVRAGTVIDKMCANIDLAPTFAALAGASVPDFVDGRSLVPLMKGQIVFEWRNAFVISRGRNFADDSAATDLTFMAAFTNPLAATFSEQEPIDSPYDDRPGGQFRGLRTDGFTYVEFANGDIELYDLKKDPYQLDNIAITASSSILSQFEQWLSAMIDCAGETCRSLEVRP